MRGLGFVALIFFFCMQAQAVVGYKERALVVISEIDTGGIPQFKKLYQVLERLTEKTVLDLLHGSYAQIEILNNEEATVPYFKETIKNLVLQEQIKAIDVIVSVHGNPNSLLFKDREWKMAEIEAYFLSAQDDQDKDFVIQMKKKLRMLYNLSCFGTTHNRSFVSMGFDASTGSINVNANSEVEFVPVLLNWRKGIGFKNSFKSSNNSVALKIADGPVRTLGKIQNNSLRYTNSKKEFLGEEKINISSDPI